MAGRRRRDRAPEDLFRERWSQPFQVSEVLPTLVICMILLCIYR